MAYDPMTERLIESLHMEAMLLADEVRAYFDEDGRIARERLSPAGRVTFACESLKITTRLMHVIAWLIARRGSPAENRVPRPLGKAPETDLANLAAMPVAARALIEASLDLHARVARIDGAVARPKPASPALQLIDRLQQAF